MQGRTDPTMPDDRRVELADFLRRRRAELQPSRADVPERVARRSPGLRREEVAELAGISTTLYTWLEQARHIPVSERTIDAIADAMQLTFQERTHLLTLARPPRHVDLDETVSDVLRRFVSSLYAQPAFVLDHAWNIVFRNPAATFVFDVPKHVERRANFIEEIFVAPRLRVLFVEWEATARALLEYFRLDYLSYPPELRASRVVENLRERSPEFAVWWAEHRVRIAPDALRRLDHARVGRLTFAPRTFAAIDSPGLRVLVFVPADDATERTLLAHLRTKARTT
ncbi:MAG: helix-turn-helix transcriptional regulator [Vulcanimicrobiaceae bacterium]